MHIVVVHTVVQHQQTILATLVHPFHHHTHLLLFQLPTHSFYLLPHNGRLLVCVHDSLTKRESAVRSTANTLQSESESFFQMKTRRAEFPSSQGGKAHCEYLKREERRIRQRGERGLGAETMHVMLAYDFSHFTFDVSSLVSLFSSLIQGKLWQRSYTCIMQNKKRFKSALEISRQRVRQHMRSFYSSIDCICQAQPFNPVIQFS